MTTASLLRRRCAGLLAAGLLLFGCRPQTSAPRFVRIEALVAAHPLEIETRALEQATGNPSPAPRLEIPRFPPAPPGALSLQKQPLGRPPETERQRRIRDERVRRAQSETERYLGRLAEFEHLRNSKILRQEERVGRRRIEVQLNRETAAREKELREVQAREIRALDRKRNDLDFRDVAIQSQIRISSGQTLQDAQQQRELLRIQLDRLAAQRETLQTDVRFQAEAEREQQRQQRTDALNQRLQVRRAELTEAVRGRLAEEQARLAADLQRRRKEAEQISEREQAPWSAAGSLQPFPRPILPDPSAAMTRADALRSAAAQTHLAMRASAESRRRSLIRSDIEQAVLQIARKRGWKLVPAGAPGAVDATAEIEPEIRAEWRSGGKMR